MVNFPWQGISCRSGKGNFGIEANRQLEDEKKEWDYGV